MLSATAPASDGLRAPEPEFIRAQEKRRRDTVLVGVGICALFSLLAWLLLQTSAAGSAGRGVKNAVFGQRVTEAVEQARGQGQGNSQSGARGQGQGQSGQSGQPGNAGQSGAAGRPGAAAQSGRQGGNANNPAPDRAAMAAPAHRSMTR